MYSVAFGNQIQNLSVKWSECKNDCMKRGVISEKESPFYDNDMNATSRIDEKALETSPCNSTHADEPRA